MHSWAEWAECLERSKQEEQTFTVAQEALNFSAFKADSLLLLLTGWFI